MAALWRSCLSVCVAVALYPRSRSGWNAWLWVMLSVAMVLWWAGKPWAASLPADFVPDDCTLSWVSFSSRLDSYIIWHAVNTFVLTVVLQSPFFAFVACLVHEYTERVWAGHLPSYTECWWDTWLLDVAGGNLVGLLIAAGFCGRGYSERPVHTCLLGIAANLCCHVTFAWYWWRGVPFHVTLLLFAPPMIGTARMAARERPEHLTNTKREALAINAAMICFALLWAQEACPQTQGGGYTSMMTLSLVWVCGMCVMWSAACAVHMQLSSRHKLVQR